MAKAFVGSNPTPRTIEQLTILCFGVFSISRRGGLEHASFLVGGRCLAGQGLFLTCFSVLGLDWGFLGLERSPGKALEYWLGGVVSESGLILGDFPGPCL